MIVAHDRPGAGPQGRLDVRAAAAAALFGRYCAVTASSSVAALYPHYIDLALDLGLADFDTATLKHARPGHLAQAFATWLYEMTDLMA